MTREYHSNLWRKLLTADGYVLRSLVTSKERTNYFEQDQIIDEMKLRLAQMDTEIRNLEELIQVQQQLVLKLFNEKYSEQEPAKHGFNWEAVEGKDAKDTVSSMAANYMIRFDCEQITDLNGHEDNAGKIIIDEMKKNIQDLQAQVKEKFDANYNLICTIKRQSETIDKLRLSNILEEHQTIHGRMPSMTRYHQGQLVTSNCITKAVEEGHLIFDGN